MGFWVDIEGILAGSSSASGVLSIHNYLNDEQSSQDGEPVELYLFDRNNGAEYWSYTSTDYDIVFGGRTYSGVLIRRGDISLDSNALKTQLEIQTALSNPFARTSIIEPIEGVVRLTIYRRHVNSYVTYWKGFVRGIRFKSQIISIMVGLKLSSLKRGGLMRKFNRNCGLVLYSPWCTISKTDSNFYQDGTINSVSGVEIDATIFETETDGWFLGGIFKTDNGNCLQRIIYHVGTIIKIARSVSALSVSQTFRAWAGCDHLKATCKDKFSNKLNYGGQPYLPDKNPFTGDAVM